MYALIAHRGFESHSLRHPRLLTLLQRILRHPDEGWVAVREAGQGWRRALFGHAAPLALIPALAWPLGHSLDPIGPQAWPLSALAASFASTFVFCVATVAIAAAAIYALAPLFEAKRDWNAAMAVAAYASTPVFLAAPLLAWASLTILVVVAFFHSCVLCRFGVQRLLGCRGDDAAMYVAAIGFVSALAGIVLGGLSSAAGIL